jgi:hypothetical protein
MLSKVRARRTRHSDMSGSSLRLTRCGMRLGVWTPTPPFSTVMPSSSSASSRSLLWKQSVRCQLLRRAMNPAEAVGGDELGEIMHRASSVFWIFSSQLSLMLLSSFSDVCICSCSAALDMVRTSPSSERKLTICCSGGIEESKTASAPPALLPPVTRAAEEKKVGRQRELPTGRCTAQDALRKISSSSLSSRIILAVGSSLTMARVWIFLAVEAYRSVDSVSSYEAEEGAMAAIMVVWELPPRHSLRSHVSTESR